MSVAITGLVMGRVVEPEAGGLLENLCRTWGVDNLWITRAPEAESRQWVHPLLSRVLWRTQNIENFRVSSATTVGSYEVKVKLELEI